jgi:hypothetical protein
MDDIMIYQVVRAVSRQRRFTAWVITLGVNCNVAICFN